MHPPLMKKFYSVVLLFLPFFSWSQTIISGTVVSKPDGRPVEFASVYINNSSTGTRTDAAGKFSLTLNSGAAEIIVTHISFEKQSVNFRAGNAAGPLKIELAPKLNSMDNVTVKIKNKETWAKWKDLFLQYFLGQTEFAKESRILNPEVIRFSYNKARQTLIARAREPLRIENKALGYLVSFDLDSFSYSFQTNMIFRRGTSFFESLPIANEADRIRQAENRLIAYQGSKMHFFRSVHSGDVGQQGFLVYQFRARQNFEKFRIRKMIMAEQARFYETKGGPSEVTISNITRNKDSAVYYQDILATPDYIFYDSVKLDLAERLAEEGGKTRSLYFGSDTLLVSFDDSVEPIFLQPGTRINRRYKQLSRELKSNYSFFSDYSMSNKQFTLLTLLDREIIMVEQNGYSHEAALYEDGYMAWKKIAHLLPWDYEPEADKKLVK
jgi:hypothetical protein